MDSAGEGGSVLLFSLGFLTTASCHPLWFSLEMYALVSVVNGLSWFGFLALNALWGGCSCSAVGSGGFAGSASPSVGSGGFVVGSAGFVLGSAGFVACSVVFRGMMTDGSEDDGCSLLPPPRCCWWS